MTVTIQEIQRIAALARVRLEQGEARRMAHDMSSILEHMAVLGETALESASASGSPQGERSVQTGAEAAGGTGRPAETGETMPDPLERPLSGMAPDWRAGFFVVPRLPGVAGASGETDEAP